MIFNVTQGAESSVPVPNSYKQMTLGMAPNCVIRAGDYVYYGSVNFGTQQYPGYYDAVYPIDYAGDVITTGRYVGIAKTGGTSLNVQSPSVYIYVYMTPDTPDPTP